MVSTCSRTLVPAQCLSVRFPYVPVKSGGAAKILDALQDGTVSFARRENHAYRCLDAFAVPAGGTPLPEPANFAVLDNGVG